MATSGNETIEMIIFNNYRHTSERGEKHETYSNSLITRVVL